MRLTDAEAEEFDEFRRSKRIFKAKERIFSLQPDASKKGMTFSRIKEVCATAERLRVSSVKSSLAAIRTVKNFLGGRINICCAVGHESSTESVIYEIKRAAALKAGELEVYVPVFDIKNGRYSSVRKILRCAVKKIDTGAVSITTDFSFVDADEYISLCSLALKFKIYSFALPQDMEFCERVKTALGADKTYIMRADDYSALETAIAFGAEKFVTSDGDALAAALIEKASESEI